MPSTQTLESFIARVEENKHVEAVEEFYTQSSSMRENNNPPRIGRDAHLAAERQMMARAKTIFSKCVRPVFVHGDHVVIRWIFEFGWHDGTSMRIEELTYQLWEGERIAQEQFFFDPAQKTARKS